MPKGWKLSSSPNKKALQQNAKGLEIVKLPRQDDFRNFCMNNDTEKVYQKLEEIISICK